MGIIDRAYYTVLAMPIAKKIIVDQNCMELIPLLEAVGLTHVKSIKVLGLDPTAKTDDVIQIHRKLKELGRKSPRSQYLFLTKNAKDFKNPDGYNVMWLPDSLNLKGFSESFKSWIVTHPKVSEGFIFQAQKSGSKYGLPYEFQPKNLKNKNS